MQSKSKHKHTMVKGTALVLQEYMHLVFLFVFVLCVPFTDAKPHPRPLHSTPTLLSTYHTPPCRSPWQVE